MSPSLYLSFPLKEIFIWLHWVSEAAHRSWLLHSGSQLWHAGSSSPVRTRTQPPCIGSSESYPLEHQGSPQILYKVRKPVEINHSLHPQHTYILTICSTWETCMEILPAPNIKSLEDASLSVGHVQFPLSLLATLMGRVTGRQMLEQYPWGTHVRILGVGVWQSRPIWKYSPTAANLKCLHNTYHKE